MKSQCECTIIRWYVCNYSQIPMTATYTRQLLYLVWFGGHVTTSLAIGITVHTMTRSSLILPPLGSYIWFNKVMDTHNQVFINMLFLWLVLRPVRCPWVFGLASNGSSVPRQAYSHLIERLGNQDSTVMSCKAKKQQHAHTQPTQLPVSILTGSNIV